MRPSRPRPVPAPLFPGYQLAGVIAGMFGVGGGMVKGPIMLAMGVHPATATATSATMVSRWVGYVRNVIRSRKNCGAK